MFSQPYYIFTLETYIPVGSASVLFIVLSSPRLLDGENETTIQLLVFHFLQPECLMYLKKQSQFRCVENYCANFLFINQKVE